MGRPINHKKIGGNTDNSGNQIQLQAWFTGESGPEDAFIVKQKTTTQFIVASVNDPDVIEVMPLVAADDLVEGTANLPAYPFGLTEQIGFTVTGAEITTGGATAVPDGDYTLIYAVDPETENYVEIVLTVTSGVFTAVASVTDGGVFETDPTGQTFTFDSVGILITEEPTLTITTVAPATGQVVESVRKIEDNRIITFEGNQYKYDISVSANEAGEADLAVA